MTFSSGCWLPLLAGSTAAVTSVEPPCKLDTLEEKLHGFVRVVFFTSSKLYHFVPRLFKATQQITFQALSSTKTDKKTHDLLPRASRVRFEAPELDLNVHNWI